MFIRLAIACAFLGSVHSAMSLTSEEVASNLNDRVQTNFYKYIDNLFKSDRFVPAGLAKSKSLQATSYSTTGFLKQSVFVSANLSEPDSSCSSLSYVTGYAVNVCFQSSDYAFMFKLNAGATDCTGGVVQYFNDRNCNLYLGSSDLLAEEGVCSAQTSTSGAEENGYQQLSCTTSASPELIANSVTSGLYPNTKCTGSPFGYVNFSPTKCNRLDMGSEAPYYFQYTCPSNVPGFTIYQDVCTGAVFATDAFSNTCSDGSDDLADDIITDDYAPPFVQPPPSVSTTALPGSQDRPASSNYFCTARAPTQQPAFAPTAFPTAAVAVQVEFTIEQIIRGIDAETFNANPVNAQVLTQTIADTMPGITPANILELTASGGRRRLQHSNMRRLQAGSSASTTVTYKVSSMTTTSAAELQNALITSVTSGAFTTDLNANAASTGGNDMVGTSSNSFASDSSGDDKLSAGAIAGIVIGCVAFVVIVIALMWCCFCRK